MDYIWSNSLDLAADVFELSDGRRPEKRDFVLHCISGFAIFDCDTWTKSVLEFVAKDDDVNAELSRLGSRCEELGAWRGKQGLRAHPCEWRPGTL